MSVESYEILLHSEFAGLLITQPGLSRILEIITHFNSMFKMSNPTSAPAPAPGETSLKTLLSTLTTTLHPSTYVFINLSTTTTISSLPPLESIQFLFQEPSEGLTLVTTLETAVKHGFEYCFPSKMITLNVQSSLDAVGFLAVITTRLAKYGMGVNPVSAFLHDHLFVPIGREEDAVRELGKLAEESRRA
jgi:hypothetical protein